MAFRRLFEKNWFCCGIIALFSLLLWNSTVRYQFVWDDEIYITQNQSIRSLANIPKMFTERSMQSDEATPTSYRPLRNLAYALLYFVDGKKIPHPAIFHLANVVLHAVVCALLFLVALLLFQRLDGNPSWPARMAALLVALGFAAQPVNSEVICWAKSLDDIMAAVFVLASARALLQWESGNKHYAASLVWFSLACFAKESGVPFALAVFFILYGFHKSTFWRSVLRTIPFFGAALFYVACRQLVMGQASQCPPISGSYGQTLIDMFPVGWEYLRLLWGIPPFCADYNFMLAGPHHRLLSLPVLLGVALLIAFGLLAWWMWQRREWRVASFGLLWTALFLLPVSNLVPMMQYMADRFLYLPLMGFLLTLAGTLLNLPRCRTAVAITALTVIVFWAGLSLARMPVWRDDLTLFFTTEMEHPGIKRVEKNAVSAVFRLPQIASWRTGQNLPPARANIMIDTLEKARRIYPNNDDLTAQLGLTEAAAGRWPKAVGYLELATRQSPNSWQRWYDLAAIRKMAGDSDGAKAACDRALKLNPDFQPARQLRAELAPNASRQSAPK